MPIRVDGASGRTSDIVLRLRKVTDGRIRAIQDSIEVAQQDAAEDAWTYVAMLSRKNLKNKTKPYVGGVNQYKKGTPNPYPKGRYETGEMLGAWKRPAETRVTGRGAVSVTFGPRDKGYDDHFVLQEVGFTHPQSGEWVPGMFAGHMAMEEFKRVFRREYQLRSRRKEYQ